MDSVLGIHGFDLQRALKASPELLNIERLPTQHDQSVSSVSLDQGAPRHLRLVGAGVLDLELVQTWISTLLEQSGEEIFRMKGVLSIAHAKQKFVCQAVHTVFNGTFAGEWVEAEVRESKLVFIGKNLDNEALKSGFAACAAASDIEEETRKRRRTK